MKAPTYRGQRVDVLLDVRSRMEFLLGHLPGALCIPVDRVESEVPRRTEIPKTAMIRVYCQSGARSARAVGVLRQLGYTRATNGGGIADLKRELR